MKKRKLLYLAFTFIMLLFTVSSCTCENPLSGLSWGSAVLRGQVVGETDLNAKQVYDAGVEGVMIYTDVGNDYCYTATLAEVNNPDPAKQPKSTVEKTADGQPRPFEVGEFEMTIRFRVGSTAKSKKITVYASAPYFPAISSVSNVLLVDGQATIPQTIKIKWK
ncbi:MAG: hypothetical protein HY934_08355 [Candidatus Firestonebacteria bacterium]|nr:hypothetical protein [Candidatus Firestonebacteria bacterium]